MSPSPSITSLLNTRRHATARSALSAASAARGTSPATSDEAVIDLLADLRHFCAAGGIDFDNCDRMADAHFATESSGGQ
jgi:hypothetical protein